MKYIMAVPTKANSFDAVFMNSDNSKTALLSLKGMPSAEFSAQIAAFDKFAPTLESVLSELFK